MSPKEAAAIVTMLANMPDSHGQAAWGLESQQLFRQLIEDLDFSAAETATLCWLRTRPRRPSISEFRDAVRQQLDADGLIPHDLEPDEAYGYLVVCFRDVGSYRPFPSAPYPLVAKVVERMGWQTLCASENPEADRAHFLRLYQAELDRQRQDRLAMPQLTETSDAVRLASRPAEVSGREVRALPVPSHVRGLIDSVMRAIGPARSRSAPVAEAIDESAMIVDAEELRRRDLVREKLRQQAATIVKGSDHGV